MTIHEPDPDTDISEDIRLFPVASSDADADLGLLSVDPVLDAFDQTSDSGDGAGQKNTNDSENTDSDNSARASGGGHNLWGSILLKLAVVGLLWKAKDWVFN